MEHLHQPAVKLYIQESHKILTKNEDVYNGNCISSSTHNSFHEKSKMIDITKDKPIKISVRVAVPVRDHPKFNFVGKLLGPKGNTLKRLQEETLCKMAVLGKGSMRDKKKEEELRLSGEHKYSHLNEDLHVDISTFAPAAEAHARIAYALAEVRRFLVPDNYDDIRQEQKWELEALTSQNITIRKCNETKNSYETTTESEEIHHEEQKHESEVTSSESQNPSAMKSNCDMKTAENVTELHAPTIAFIEKPILHPTLRGVNIAGTFGRKRPLLCSARSPLNPTKRTVMTFLAKAKNANAFHGFHPAGLSITDGVQLIAIPPTLDMIPTTSSVLQK